MVQSTLTDWHAILAAAPAVWNEARRRAQAGPNVLIATSVGGFSALTVVESLLAVALTLRGANVHTLLCDKVLPACLRVEKPEVPDPGVLERYELAAHLCEGCMATGRHLFAPLNLTSHVFSTLITDDERLEARRIATSLRAAEIPTFQKHGCGIGEHAFAGALRYFASGTLDREPAGELVSRRFLEGALLTSFAVRRLLELHRFDVAAFNHGLYSPQGVVGEVCRSAGVPVVNWNVAYRKRCFIFSHGDTYHHTLLAEPTATWECMPWTDVMERQIVEYLESRWHGSRDWIWFHEKPDLDFDRFAATAGLDSAKPIVGMLTNVMWDAQLHYRANAFPNMLSWVLATIDYFRNRPDIQLLIRIHPAEIRGTMRSRQPLLPEIDRAIPDLPKNVFIIAPESPVSTYSAMMRCNAVIIYGTKTGVELTSMGIPVIVAGEAWIRNKGLTFDVSSPGEYVEMLDRLPFERTSDREWLTRARKYAYHFFFRRMVPLSFMEPCEGWPPYRIAISRVDDLMPGRDPGLDIVCDGILSRSPFVYPAESLGVGDAGVPSRTSVAR